MNVLIVDDQYINRYLLEKLLGSYGFTVISAENGEEALEKLNEEEVDLIIADILLPVMDGFQFCREVKGSDELKHIPFVFYTAAYTEKKDHDFALSLGADRFIVKPTDPLEFISIIRELIADIKAIPDTHEAASQLSDAEYLTLHNNRLFHQLEKKLGELEDLNRALRRSEERYRNLFDCANDIIILHEMTSTERPGFIREVNGVACRQLGYSREDLLTMRIPDIDSPQMEERYPELIASLLEKGNHTFDGELVTRSGLKIPVEISARTYMDDGVRMCLSIFRDISERKKNEAELTRLVVRINENLHQMAVMSDKIRNPLAIILSACEQCQVSTSNPHVINAVNDVDQLIKEIDTGWVESDKVRNFLLKNYGIYTDNNL